MENRNELKFVVILKTPIIIHTSSGISPAL